MFYVYIIKSKNDSFVYTGLTKNLERRLREHKSGHTKSTKGHAPFEIVYIESFHTLAEARKREKFFKSGSGRELRNKILSKHIPR